MKKLIVFLVTFLASGLIGVAQASTEAPAWICQLRGEMSGGSIGLLVGFQSLNGNGSILCNSPTGDMIETPVRLQMVGLGAGLGFSAVERVQVITAGIGVISGPQDFYGKYNVGISAGTTLVAAGISADLSMALTRGGFGFEIGLTGKEAVGLEAHIHATTFSIRPY